MCNNWIQHNFNEELKYLESLKREDLEAWLERAINNMPYPIWLNTDDIIGKLILYYEHSNIALKQKIKKSIHSLLHSHNPQYASIKYLKDLFFLIGRLRITEAFDTALSFLTYSKTLYLKNHIKDDDLTDIQLHCFRAVASQIPKNHKETLNICLKKINEKSAFFGICYRILFTYFEKNNEPHLIEFFPKFLEHCKNGKLSFETNINFIVNVLVEKNETDLDKILKQMLKNVKEADLLFLQEKTNKIISLSKENLPILVRKNPEIYKDFIKRLDTYIEIKLNPNSELSISDNTIKIGDFLQPDAEKYELKKYFEEIKATGDF